MENPYRSKEFLFQILRKAVGAKASDVHLKVGQPPAVRVAGELVYFKVDTLVAANTQAVAHTILTTRDEAHLLPKLKEHDCSFDVPELGRFRVNLFRQKGAVSIAMRHIPDEVPSIERLGLPPPIVSLATQENGLGLVVGAAGNGKSTTVASMVRHINETRRRHIVTIEDPIEFLHHDALACVSQREVGSDTASFADALRAALRQDPDVIVLGEIRDPVTMEIAIQAAETGHMVLSTMHTPDVTRTLNRLLALADDPVELRERVAVSLRGVVAQRLVPAVGGGRILAQEIMVVTGTVREALRRPESNPPLKELMEKGVRPYGMQTFKMALGALLHDKKITRETAQKFS